MKLSAKVVPFFLSEMKIHEVFLKKKWVYLSEGCKIWVRKRKGKVTINVSMGKRRGIQLYFYLLVMQKTVGS